MNDLEFDRRARALHQQSLESLSPRVRAQLHHRLQSAMSAPRAPRHAHRWGLATAAVLALAIGFGVPWTGIDEPAAPAASSVATRSEEHTSELQSLMRISYAVLCLKKKKTHNVDQHHTIKERSDKVE